MSSKVSKISDSEFKSKVLKSHLPTVVQFEAAWCGPCKRIAPFLGELAEEYAGQVNVVTVDLEECPETSNFCAIRSVPSFILFRDGEAIQTLVGTSSAAKIRSLFKGAHL
jgi:thioredoxin 1